jgi:5-methyltetrahydrofolate--homocysteine methyltransferase
MISGTITDPRGRTLSGQTVEAFWNSVRHAKPLSVGLNCALGARSCAPTSQELSRVAGLLRQRAPERRPAQRVGRLRRDAGDHGGGDPREFATSGLVNVVGGCCGTTPEHIRAIADGGAGWRRARPEIPPPAG